MPDREMEWSEFIALVESFLNLSERAGDVWCLKGRKEELGGAYLVRKMRQCGEFVPAKCRTDSYGLEDPRMESRGDSSSLTSEDTIDDKGQEQFWEHHVVYSVGYRVPVIYFNAWTSTGELLSLEEIWREARKSFTMVGDVNGPGMWELVSQQEHPVLGKPFFMLHPCRTAEFLSSVGALAVGNVLVPWLSSLGPLVNLRLHPSYAFENEGK